MKREQLNELLYQSLETELGGVLVYTTALKCAVNEDLKEEWEEYLEQTQTHVQIVQQTMETLGLDPEVQTPGRQVVHHIGQSLVKAMEMALEAGDPAAAHAGGRGSLGGGTRLSCGNSANAGKARAKVSRKKGA